MKGWSKKIGVDTGAPPKVYAIVLPVYTDIGLALADMMIRINLLITTLR